MTTSTERRKTMAAPGQLEMVIIALVFLVIGPKVGRIPAADWPQWRGPNRDAISEETGLLGAWTGDSPKNVWNASGLGEGYASVVVSRGRVFTLGKLGEDTICFALDARTGNEGWARKIGTTTRTPLSTPTVDGDRLYTLDPDGDLACLDTTTGEIIWQKSFLEDFGGRMMSGRGYGESPLVDGERLICTPGGNESMLVALDKVTGDVVWESVMPDIGPRGGDGAGFSSIVVTEAHGIRQFVQLVGRGVIGVAADDGRFLWGYNDLAVQTANIPTPVVRGDLVFSANGYGAGSVLLKLMPEGTGGISAEEVYRLRGSRFQNHHGGIVLVRDHVYGGHGSNNGLPTCIELESGRIVWKRRGPGIGSAAVVFADGQLYFRYQNGLMALIDATPHGYLLKGTFQIPGAGGDSWSHPVIADGRLYLREKDQLWVYDVRTGAAVSATPGLPATDDTAVISLRELGVAVELLKPDGSSRSWEKRRIDRYLAVNRGPEDGSRSLVVILTHEHLTSDGRIDTARLQALYRMSQPFLLNMAGAPVSDEGLRQISEIPQIAGLNLELCRHISDRGLATLRNSSRLRVLSLTGTGVTDNGLNSIAEIKSLRALDLEVCDGVTDAGCESLAAMKELQALVLKKTGFEPLRITGAGLQYLGRLSRLELLNLYGNNISDAELVQLQGMKQLRELDLSLLPITDAGLVHLLPLTHLERLDLLFSTGFSGPVITNHGLNELRHLKSLKSVNLIGSRITDDGVSLLTTLEHLVELNVINTGLTEAGVHGLEVALPQCRIER